MSGRGKVLPLTPMPVIERGEGAKTKAGGFGGAIFAICIAITKKNLPNYSNPPVIQHQEAQLSLTSF